MSGHGPRLTHPAEPVRKKPILYGSIMSDQPNLTTSEPLTVVVDRHGPVEVITINRPHARNAVDGPTATALYDAFRRFDADEDAAVAVLTGAENMFCAGADLKAIATDRETESRLHHRRRLSDRWGRWARPA